MGQTLKLTLGQGNQYLSAALMTECPAEVGNKKFGPNARAKINERFRQLAKCLKKVSVNKSGEGGWIFGLNQHPDAWKRTDLEVMTPRLSDGKGGSVEVQKVERSSEMQDVETHPLWSIKDPEKEVEVEVNAQGLKGFYWLGYLWAKPDSPMHEKPGFLDEIVWPIIEAIGKAGDLSKDLGLGDEEEEEPEASKDTKIIQHPSSKPEEKKAEEA